MSEKQKVPVVRYVLPSSMIRYDPVALASELVEAKASVLALRSIPYQRAWVDELQKMELKREVAGTSRIEGAQFTEKELELALKQTPEEALNRSQRQARAAVNTYRWIAVVPPDRPVNGQLITEIHRRIVTGADDDHCMPGRLRQRDENVTFGIPLHRGAEGGDECREAFERLCRAIETEYAAHDPLIQALASHYQLAAMHPFGDGNGRTARALEALLLQRSGLRDACFIAMSNYYYEEKAAYLAALNAARSGEHDLTPFLKFGLRGIASQSGRLLEEIRHHVARGLYRNVMFDLFTRLKTRRTRVIAERQIEILKLLLKHESMELSELIEKSVTHYTSLKSPRKALIRDLNGLLGLRAIQAAAGADGTHRISVRLEWPTEITESKFFEYVNALPRARTHQFLR